MRVILLIMGEAVMGVKARVDRRSLVIAGEHAWWSPGLFYV
jgi:hypothetical protein